MKLFTKTLEAFTVFTALVSVAPVVAATADV